MGCGFMLSHTYPFSTSFTKYMSVLFFSIRSGLYSHWQLFNKCSQLETHILYRQICWLQPSSLVIWVQAMHLSLVNRVVKVKACCAKTSLSHYLSSTASYFSRLTERHGDPLSFWTAANWDWSTHSGFVQGIAFWNTIRVLLTINKTGIFLDLSRHGTDMKIQILVGFFLPYERLENFVSLTDSWVTLLFSSVNLHEVLLYLP